MNTRLGRWLVAVLLLGCAAVAVAADRSPYANYVLRCAGCHGLDGEGVITGGIPPFPGYVDALFRDEQARLYLMHVPGVVGASLSNQEIAEVMNYVVQRWGTESGNVRLFTEEEVGRLRAQPVVDVVAFRREIAARFTAAGIPIAEYPWP